MGSLLKIELACHSLSFALAATIWGVESCSVTFMNWSVSFDFLLDYGELSFIHSFISFAYFKNFFRGLSTDGDASCYP